MEGMVTVSGYSLIAPDATELFVKLKRLGANWHTKRRVWEVPEEKLAIALSLSPKLKAASTTAMPTEAPKPASKPPEATKPASPPDKPKEAPPAPKPPEAAAPPAKTGEAADPDNFKVSGPGIDLLKNSWEMMGQRGAPIEINDYGFAKGHFDLYKHMSLHPDFHSNELPIKMVKRMLDVLGYYRKTQMADRWDRLVEMVKADVKTAQQSKGIKQQEHGDKKVYVYNAEPRHFNRLKVHIPSLDVSLKRKVNKLMDDHFIAKKMPMDMDKFSGQPSYSTKRYQNFQNDKSQIDIYWVSPNVLPSILELFKAEGYEVAYQDDSHLSEAPGRPKLKVLGQNGRKLLVSYELDYVDNVKLREELQSANLWRRPDEIDQGGIAYMGKDQRGISKYGIAMEPTKILARVAEILRKYVDIAELDQELKKLHGVAPAASSVAKTGEVRLGMADKGGNKMSIKTPFVEEKTRVLIKQVITYTFPESSFNWDAKTWDVEGNYQQYSLFKKLLDRYKWDTSKLEEIIEAKIKAGGLIKEALEGEIPDGFEDKVDADLPESDFDLNQLQKEGVAFLHHRRSAILGDETGFGKTVQLVSAAEMKMKESGYKGDTLIIVPKQGGTTVEQWEQTILRVIGEKNKGLISRNPLEPRRWTVLWYEMFSIPAKMKAKRDAIVESLKKHNFLVVIMDELHKVKKAEATKTQNILEVIEKIPVHWGASATISSNWPIDVRQQLAMVGHHLGRIAEGKFKREFAGMVPKGYNNSYIPGDIEDQIRAAENLNKWLHLTGLYVRRSKEDVRDMPGLSVTQKDATFDYNDYQNRMSTHINRLKDPELVISILNAAREEIAVSKVPATVAKVTDLVKQGRKVVVFTAFLQAGYLLKEQLRAAVKQLNPDWDILTYTSDTHKKERAMAKGNFTNNHKYRVILMSIKMGGTGIDFPNAAQNMVINDYDWTPEQAEQSEGRIYRINTEKPVTIEYMIAPGTIDEALFTKVQQKRELASIIQKYRKEYQEDHEPEAALEKIIMYRKQLEELNEEIKRLRVEAARMFKPKAHESVESDDYYL